MRLRSGGGVVWLPLVVFRVSKACMRAFEGSYGNGRLRLIRNWQSIWISVEGGLSHMPGVGVEPGTSGTNRVRLPSPNPYPLLSRDCRNSRAHHTISVFMHFREVAASREECRKETHEVLEQASKGDRKALIDLKAMVCSPPYPTYTFVI